MLAKVVGADIVEAHDVVSVAVGEEHSIEAVEVGAQGLLPKVGSGVNDGEFAGAREEQGRAEALVVRIWRTAHAAVAAERRDAHGGAGAEDGEF